MILNLFLMLVHDLSAPYLEANMANIIIFSTGLPRKTFTTMNSLLPFKAQTNDLLVSTKKIFGASLWLGV